MTMDLLLFSLELLIIFRLLSFLSPYHTINPTPNSLPVFSIASQVTSGFVENINAFGIAQLLAFWGHRGSAPGSLWAGWSM